MTKKMESRVFSTLSKPGAAFWLLSFAAFAPGCGGTDSVTSVASDASTGGGSSGPDAGGSGAGTGGGAQAGGAAGAHGGGGSGASAATGGSGGSSSSGGAGDASDSGSGGGGVDASAAPGHPVDLGASGSYVVLAKSGISTVPTSAITGNLGVSPAAATYITGFSLTKNATNVFSTTPQVTGKVYAADYASPTPSNLTTAVSDMQHAFTDAAGRAADVTELGAGNIGGMTLDPGVYKWGTGLLIPTNLTLDGGPTAVWIFQIAQKLTVNDGVHVTLSGGALPKNVFWQVGGQASLGTTAHFEGVVLGQTSITLGTGASINGRLLAQTAVSLQASTLVQPAP